MHRHVWRVGDQVSFGIEQCATKIQTFLYVYRIRRVGEPQSHLLGNRHKQIVEHFKHDRIGLGTDGIAHSARHCSRE